MQYAVGIVPPYEYQQKLITFQRSWSNNRIYTVVEPHITVKAQGGLTANMSWLHTIKGVCASFPRFQVSLTEPLSFGSTVIYLGVESKEIRELHELLVHAVSPSPELIQRYFELDLYTPHLTLGQTYWGMTESELREMKTLAMSVLHPFPSFKVEHIRVYREVERDKYEPFEDIKLV